MKLIHLDNTLVLSKMMIKQQLKFDFQEKRKIKETVISYYEETDTDGKRRIHKETKETKWFSEGVVVDTIQLFLIIQSIMIFAYLTLLTALAISGVANTIVL